jgi:hypothetical protein
MRQQNSLPDAGAKSRTEAGSFANPYRVARRTYISKLEARVCLRAFRKKRLIGAAPAAANRRCLRCFLFAAWLALSAAGRV